MDSQAISSLKSHSYLYAYNIKMVKKFQEVATQSGLNALKLIDSLPKITSNRIDLYA